MKSFIEFLKNRIQSFRHAFAGLKDILTTEHNAKVHAVCTVIVLLLCFWVKLPFSDFVLIGIVISLVWIAEAFNTVLEIVIDIVSPEYTKAAKRAKDIAACAVLFAAIGAFITGIIILGPPALLKLGIG
jgi:diacylglycerol kinase (ATP)